MDARLLPDELPPDLCIYWRDSHGNGAARQEYRGDRPQRRARNRLKID
jgi:hypothetical protein